ncbi:LTXXQ motif family protein [Devosia lucknowensis]|uniref:LTXXQ motif family protein n=1 Tax=Devosia lucknowensis TaxID=1096929 RepID=A0A1Y6F6I0_9HYPH|nr:Spy/CpxP family protein refolding chaperone [Devosia lucknowensis]SMQ70387.1 LTXXQ motif family protein [Devosia lucknowensis]
MKTISTTAIVALMTASIGLGAVAPVLAQDNLAPPAAEQPAAPDNTMPAPGADRNLRNGPGPRHGGMGGPAGLFDVDRGAEAIEVAIVRLSHAIDLSDDQTTLFDTLKTDALAAAAEFETATKGLRPTPPAEGEAAVAPDISERFNNRIALDKARLAAHEAVQPAFTAFFDSLTDEQKAELMPARGERHAGAERHQGGFRPGHGGDAQRPMGPGNR